MKPLIISLLLLMSAPSMAKVIIGTVNIQKILLSVNQGKKVRDELKKSFEAKQKIIKKEESDIRKKQNEIKKQSSLLSQKALANKEKEIQEAIFNLQKKTAAFQKEIRELEDKRKEPILKRVRDIINEVSKKAGVDLTFEISTTPLVYSKEHKDLTDQVISLYNKKHPK